jgi:hypothetical protein
MDEAAIRARTQLYAMRNTRSSFSIMSGVRQRSDSMPMVVFRSRKDSSICHRCRYKSQMIGVDGVDEFTVYLAPVGKKQA